MASFRLRIVGFLTLYQAVLVPLESAFLLLSPRRPLALPPRTLGRYGPTGARLSVRRVPPAPHAWHMDLVKCWREEVSAKALLDFGLRVTLRVTNQAAARERLGVPQEQKQ